MKQLRTNIFPWLTYFFTGVGVISIILSVFNLTSGEFLDLLLIGNVLGVLGIISLVFVLLPKVNYFSLDRNHVMGMAISLSFSLIFILSFRNLTLFEAIEDFSIDLRFRLSAGQFVIEEEAPGTIVERTNPKAHRAIQIIGIDNQAVNAYQGFPFSWDKYAQLLEALDEQTLNTIMFDIFFLDSAKNNFGLLSVIEDMRLDAEYYLNSGIQVSASSLRSKSRYFSDAVKENGRVIVDYAFETEYVDSETLRDLLESDAMKNRLDALNQYRIPPENIIENEYLSLSEWVTYPAPPIQEIARSTQGLGAANVKYEKGKANYKMPMVFKWRNQLYPSISLLMAARYYGVDVTKDVEVKLGEYVKIKNIPKKMINIGVEENPSDIMVHPNAAREVVIPVNDEGMMNINFIGSAFSFPNTSIYEINSNNQEFPGVYGGENRDYFRNKILLVAMYYATGVAKDIHPSPFGNIAGIEHHANALNTILMQDFLRYAPAWVDYIIFILVGLVIGYIVPRRSIQVSLLTAIFLAIVFLVEVFVAFNMLNYIHTFLTPYIQMTLTMITIVAYRALSEEQNVKYIRSTFSKFVSKDVVNELLENPEALALGGEKKEITVFFSDIRGFTTISESLSPEELVSLLNDYLSEMTNIVLGYRGTIDKYMGDAIMAFWGAPVPSEEHAYTACVSALKQLHKLDELKKKWHDQGLPLIDIGIGLNSGPAVVGNMGSAHRMDYTAMGDSINLGSRLEGTNKVYGTRIIISEYTYESVKDRVITRELDLIRVKGKNEPVKIYELLDIKNQEDYDKYMVAV